MLETGDGDTWVFRRNDSITAPRGEMISERDGVPYLRPQGVLLYKARNARDKDEADFEKCLPVMDAAARRWLSGALIRAHPGHDWIRRLG
jgi:hypothetical protein